MSSLKRAMEEIGITGRLSHSGKMLTLKGDFGEVYVAEAGSGAVFYAWCNHPDEHLAKRYPSAVDAIREGLTRAGRRVDARSRPS